MTTSVLLTLVSNKDFTTKVSYDLFLYQGVVQSYAAHIHTTSKLSDQLFYLSSLTNQLGASLPNRFIYPCCPYSTCSVNSLSPKYLAYVSSLTSYPNFYTTRHLWFDRSFIQLLLHPQMPYNCFVNTLNIKFKAERSSLYSYGIYA